MGSYQYLPGWVLLLLAASGPVCCLLESGESGKSVNLTVKLNLPAQREVQWKFGTNSMIVSAQPGSNPLYYGAYRGRCTLYGNTTLRLDNLTAADTGQYTLTVTNVDTAAQQQGSVNLTVHSPLTPPTLKVNVPTTNGNAYPVNGTIVSLHCDAGAQNVVNYTFYKDGVTACSQPHVTCDKDFLYFQPIMMSDTGRYTCKIENPVSSNTSQPLSLTVTGRVLGVALSSNASSGLLWAGKDSVRLTCSALGTNVTFSWHLDGAPLPTNPRYHLMNSNSSLIISPVERTDNGSFTCTASNSLNSETSSPLTLNLGYPPDGNVQCNAVSSGQAVTLSCSWPGGNPAANVTLIFQNQIYTAQDTLALDILLGTFSSGAELACLGTQEGQITVSTMILETPIGATSNPISSVMEGENVTMYVNLNWSRTVSPGFQILPATFSWFHLNPDPSLLTNGGKISVNSNDYKSELVISSVTASESGIYKCVAENFLGNSTFSFELSVNTGSSSSQLSPGAIAGIVIAALFVVALIPLTVIFILHKTNNNNSALVSTKTLSFDNTPTAPTYENAETPATNNATYDCVIITSEENMAGNNAQESAYQDLQFPHHDLYKTLKKLSS